MKLNDSIFSPFFYSASAVFVSLALLAGCGGDPSSPGRDNEPPITMNLVYPPILFPESYVPAGSDAVQSLAVYIFDVTDNPFVRTATLFANEIEPVVADTAALDVPEGEVAFLDTTYDLDVGEQSRDYRIRVEKFSGVNRRGSRTVTGLAAGETREVDLYLTPVGPPGPGEYGIQLVETWAESGESGHLIPVVLVNADSVGGFQFDLYLQGGVISDMDSIVVDGDSRLYLDANSSSIVQLADNDLGDSLRVIAFRGVDQPAVEPGYAVVLYLRVDLESRAATDTLRLGNVTISNREGDSIPSDSVTVLDAVIHIDEI